MVRPENLSLRTLNDLFDSGEITVEQLNELVRKYRALCRDTNQTLHNGIVAAQSAYIAGNTDGPERAMEWLHNYLWGPGLLPSDDDMKDGAQAYSDKHHKL